MLNASPRVKKLMVAGAALAALGIGLPANANSGGPPTFDEPKGMAHEKAQPKGQSKPGEADDHNRGFTCDGNKGVGGGNPALNPTCPTTPGGGGGGTTDGDTGTGGDTGGGDTGGGDTGYTPVNG